MISTYAYYVQDVPLSNFSMFGFPQRKTRGFPAIQVTSAITFWCPRMRFQPSTSIMFHHGIGRQHMCMYNIYIYIY